MDQTPLHTISLNERHQAKPKGDLHSNRDCVPDVVTLITNIHEREHEVQRRLEDWNLEECVKLGNRKFEFALVENNEGELVREKRWRYRHNGVTCITNQDSTVVIKKWSKSLRLQKVKLHPRAHRQHNIAKKLIAANPDKVTSHAVLVLDQSGSMRTQDVEAHSSRSDAVFYDIATSFIAKKLHKQGDSITCFDLVTLIEFRDGATVTFKREPMTWVLYNKIVDRARQRRKVFSHGEYYHALEAALDALTENDHENLEQLLFFLSDGKPSDMYLEKSTRWKLRCLTGKIGLLFQHRLVFGMVSYGCDKWGEKVLMDMSKTLDCCGCIGRFYRSDVSVIGSLGTTLTALSTSLHSTKSRLSTTGKLKGTQRDLQFDTHIEQVSDGKSINLSLWRVYTQQMSSAKRHKLMHVKKNTFWRRMDFLHQNAVGIAVKKKPFAKGAERVVYQMVEIDGMKRCVGEVMVAKEPLHIEQMQAKKMEQFHLRFCKTQHTANHFARMFNLRLRKLNLDDPVPNIRFVDCSVYGAVDANGNQLYLLAEKYLKGVYRKYNDNQGGYRGKKKDVERDGRRVRFNLNEEIINVSDVDSDEEDSFHMDDEIEIPHTLTDRAILDSEVPAAFSHFTYVHSNHKKLVCDLQGCLNTSVDPPVFELTDPAIHHRNRRVYGRTDRGNTGIRDFLDSHKCNSLCALLKLDRKYKKDV